MRESLRPGRKPERVEIALRFAVECVDRRRERTRPANCISRKLNLEKVGRLQDIRQPRRNSREIGNSRNYEIPPAQAFTIVQQHQADQRYKIEIAIGMRESACRD